MYPVFIFPIHLSYSSFTPEESFLNYSPFLTSLQLADIEGLETSLLPSYREKVIENNINGRVLVTCELNELREAMQMKFGDWQLFKAWITASRYKEGSCRYASRLVFYST